MLQSVDGLSVYGTYVKASVDPDGHLESLIENVASVTSSGIVPARIDAAEAFDVALVQLYPGLRNQYAVSNRSGKKTTFDGGDFFYQDPTVMLIGAPLANGTLTPYIKPPALPVRCK